MNFVIFTLKVIHINSGNYLKNYVPDYQQHLEWFNHNTDSLLDY